LTGRKLRELNGVAKKHGNGRNPDPTEPGRNPTSLLPNCFVYIWKEAFAAPRDPSADDDGVVAYHRWGDDAGLANA
jgi:hypothetical protein